MDYERNAMQRKVCSLGWQLFANYLRYLVVCDLLPLVTLWGAFCGVLCNFPRSTCAAPHRYFTIHFHNVFHVFSGFL